MKKGSELYKLVYEYYEARILHGFYPFDTRLPSINKICDIFHLAPTTVRRALAGLEKEGYIRIDARRAARVTYQKTPGQLRENAARYFVPRGDGILDLTRSGGLLLEPLWKAGLSRWDDLDWEALRRDIANPASSLAAVPVEFYILAVNALDNRLALNLLWETIRYLRFPYLTNSGGPLIGSGGQPVSTREEAVALLRQESERSYGTHLNLLMTFIGQARQEYQLCDAQPVPFTWNIYRQRPQLRYSLAATLIRSVANGQFPKGSYLPSLPQLVDQYHVPLMTVRRTLETLEELGITRSYHGKGTMVCMTPVEIHFSNSAIQEGFLLYRDCLQLLALTCRGIARCTLDGAGPEKTCQLRERYRSLIEEGKSFLCYDAILSFIVSECPLGMVRECYDKLQKLLAWGYPFALSQAGENSLHSVYEKPAAQLLGCLCTGSADDFSALLEQLFLQEEALVRRFVDSRLAH